MAGNRMAMALPEVATAEGDPTGAGSSENAPGTRAEGRVAETATGGRPSVYVWEATNEQVAARYGIPLGEIVRFDLNTSPLPPVIAQRILAAGSFEASLSEYPPSDYRLLVAAAAEVYGVAPDEIVVGAGADEILDMIAKAFLPPGGSVVVPVPTYAMFRVVSEQRTGHVLPIPRLGRDQGHAIDALAIRAAAREASIVWLCSPNNPTALEEPDGLIADLLDGLLEDAAADSGRAPVVVLDEAYAEFVGRSLLGLRDRYPRLIVVRTASKAYALAGMRVGFAIARRDVLAEIEPYRPPGSVSVPSVTVVTEALLDGFEMRANVERLIAQRARLTDALRALGWDVGPSVTNFVLVSFGSVERAATVADGLLRRGLVPRTFGPRHPLADHLRLTVRSAAENDRLIAAAGEIARQEDPR